VVELNLVSNAVDRGVKSNIASSDRGVELNVASSAVDRGVESSFASSAVDHRVE
jgi:hypothetical protein